MFIDASNLIFPSQVSDASLPVGLPDRWRVPLVLTLLPLPPLSHPQPLALGALIFQRLIGTVGLQPLRGPVRRSRSDVFTSRLSRPASCDRSGSIGRLPHLALQLVWRLACHLSVLALGTVGWRVARSGGTLRPIGGEAASCVVGMEPGHRYRHTGLASRPVEGAASGPAGSDALAASIIDLTAGTRGQTSDIRIPSCSRRCRVYVFPKNIFRAEPLSASHLCERLMGVRFVLGGAEVPVLTGFFAAVAIRLFDSRSPASGLANLADRVPADGLAMTLDILTRPCQRSRCIPCIASALARGDISCGSSSSSARSLLCGPSVASCVLHGVAQLSRTVRRDSFSAFSTMRQRFHATGSISFRMAFSTMVRRSFGSSASSSQHVLP